MPITVTLNFFGTIRLVNAVRVYITLHCAIRADCSYWAGIGAYDNSNMQPTTLHQQLTQRLKHGEWRKHRREPHACSWMIAVATGKHRIITVARRMLLIIMLNTETFVWRRTGAIVLFDISAYLLRTYDAAPRAVNTWNRVTALLTRVVGLGAAETPFSSSNAQQELMETSAPVDGGLCTVRRSGGRSIAGPAAGRINTGLQHVSHHRQAAYDRSTVSYDLTNVMMAKNRTLL